MNNSIRAVVFDLDGVLIDSRLLMEVSWNKVKKKYNIDRSFEEYSKHIGIPFLEIMVAMGVNENIAHIEEDYFMYAQENRDLINMYEGADSIFSILRDKGIATGIITSKVRSNTLSICSKFEFTPDEIITPDDVITGKPDPESGREYLNRTGLNKKNILYVGDMESDLIFSKNIGFQFIFASYGYGSIGNNKCIKIDNLLDVMTFL